MKFRPVDVLLIYMLGIATGQLHTFVDFIFNRPVFIYSYIRIIMLISFIAWFILISYIMKEKK